MFVRLYRELCKQCIIPSRNVLELYSTLDLSEIVCLSY